MKRKLKVLAWKILWKLFPPETEADRIRAMSDRDLVLFVHGIQSGDEPWSDFAKTFCSHCPATGVMIRDGQRIPLHDCDDLNRGCPYGDDVAWWLQQEVDHAEL